MKKSKLDQYAATLLDMRLAGKSVDEMQEWLKVEGIIVGRSTVGDFVLQLLQKHSQDRLLNQIATGANQVKEVEKQFGENPAPELETLIKLHRVLILQLSTQGNANPEFLKLSDQLLRTAMEFMSGQTKAALEKQKLSIADRRTKLLEKKAEAFDQAQGILGNKELSEDEKKTRMQQLFGI